MAALLHRDRTGEGVYIDQAQAEGAMHFLATPLLDLQANGRMLERDGNRDPNMAPHGVFPSVEDDGWVAIAARSDEEWAALATLLGHPELADDPRFASLATRQANEDELNSLVTAWTAMLPGAEVESRLQAEGVPAHVVQGSALAFADPQLQHRGSFVEVEHPTAGHGRRGHAFHDVAHPATGGAVSPLVRPRQRPRTTGDPRLRRPEGGCARDRGSAGVSRAGQY